MMQRAAQRQMWVAVAMMLASSTGGCAALAKAAAFDPAALALVPVAAAAQILTLAAHENRRSNGMINVLPTSATPTAIGGGPGGDPDDWVADCDGPMLCEAHEQFSCSGGPGDCYCACVGSSTWALNERATW